MKNKLIIILAVLLVVIIALSAFFVVRGGQQRENAKAYAVIVEKMKQGGQYHLLLPEIENLLKRQHLKSNIANNAHIIAAYIHFRMNDFDAADHSFSQVKIEGVAFDVRDYIYYWWGQGFWKQYQQSKDPASLGKARDLFKKVIDVKDTPLKNQATFDFVRSCFYDNDMNFIDTISESFAVEFPNFNKGGLPEFLYIIGSAHIAKGERQRGMDVLVDLWRQFPATSWGAKAEDRLDEMGAIDRISFPAISLVDISQPYLDICERGRSQSGIAKMLKRLERNEKSVPIQAMDLYHLLVGRMYDKLKKKTTANGHFEKAFRSNDKEIKLQAAYYQVLQARDRYQLAKLKFLVSAIDHLPFQGSKFFEKTIYAAGFPFMRKKMYRDAADIYSRVIKKNVPENEYYEQALWRLHWCHYHLRNYSAVIGVLEKMKNLEKWEDYSLYWMAYTLKKKADSESDVSTAERDRQGRREILKQLLSRFGLTYYGYLAEKELRAAGESIGEAQRGEFVPLQVGLIENESRNKRYKALVENGLFEFAAMELRAFMEEKKIDRLIDLDNWRPYGSELAKLNFYSGNYIKAGLNLNWTYKEYLLKGAENPQRWIEEINYPIFYKDLIDRYADQYGIEKDFLYAFIRQESFYEPFVVSPAGAIGVMQIMPATGSQIFKEMGSSLGLREYSPTLLYNPEVSIPMGIYHLRKQLYDRIRTMIQRYNPGAARNEDMLIALTIAGYNAGIGRPARWLKEIDYANEMELIDQFDIAETRQYVKLVIKHEYNYSKIKR